MDKSSFSPSYFVDEIREGFYVPGMVKRSWAVQMDILSAISTICDKHNIKWFANYGTLLGAVRHGGFIPWDDDLDIAMFRDDYIRFLNIICDELPERYRVLNFNTELEYELFLTRIVNNSQIDISNEYLLNNHGFPYVAGIDIFPLDYLFADEKKEFERKERCRYVWDLVSKLDSTEISNYDIERDVKKKTGYSIDSSIPLKASLLRIIDAIFQECESDSAKEVTLMPIWIEHNAQRCPIDLYEDLIEVPFENDTILVPGGYDEILSIEYGDWETINKSGGLHEYPFYKEQEGKLVNEKGRAPYKYLFNEDNLDNKLRIKHKEASDGIFQMILTLEEAICMLGSFINNINDKQMIFDMLNTSQQLAIEIGGEIENSYSDCDIVIAYLERLCEEIYEISILFSNNLLQVDNNKIIDIIDTIKTIKQLYGEMTKKQKSIIFMPVKKEDWKYMEGYYQKMQEEKVHIWVMPLPFAYRLDDGTAGEFETEIGLFNTSLPLISYDDLDFSTFHSDELVIQNPWDEFGSGIVVHPAFFSSRLKEYTDNLVYIPQFRLNNCCEEREIANAEYYSVCPAVIHSDIVILNDENEKAIYIKWLKEKTSINDSNYWNEKIKVEEMYAQNDIEPKSEDKNKQLLIYVSFSDIYCNRRLAIEWLRKVISTIENKGELLVEWLMDYNMIENMEEIMPELVSDFKSILHDFENSSRKTIDYRDIQAAVNNASAYYGSRGIPYNMCVNKHIPTMLRNIKLYN